MKDISTYLTERLNEERNNGGSCEEESIASCEEESIASEEDFKAWAKAKFEEVFGDDLDEEQFKITLKGFLRDNKELVDKGEWGELVGMMNASFAKK